MDGTLNRLTFELQCQDASDYSGRKYGYSLSALVVNDNKPCITYFLAGWPGSTHGNCIFKNSHLCQDFNPYFSECEYLLGDLAFNVSHSSLGCINRQAMNHEEQIFNDALTSPCVSSEHTIGMWKGRFPWLHSNCMKITSSKMSVQHILRIIEASVVLHNYLIEEHDGVLEDWRDDSDISDGDDALSDDDELNNVASQLCLNDH